MSLAEIIAWVLGLAGIAGTAAAIALFPEQVPHAWLAAFAAWIGWPLGSMALLLVHALTGGRWGDAIRPQLIGGMRALPLAVPALLVLLAALPELYPWARNGVWVGNSWYLNTHFFTGRLVLYAVVWVVLWALVSLGVYRGWTMMWLAPPALMLLMLTCTYMSIDTVMSLEPKFKSSDWGMVTASAGGLYALAIAALSVAGRPEVRDDLAQLLLGLLALWAYLEFMQILIIWQGNLPNEIYWYLIRSVGLWAWLAGLITLGHFMVPFFALLRQRWRRSRAVLVTVAGLIVTMEIVRNWWLVIPEAGRGIRLVDAAAVLALGGISAAIAIRPIRRARSFEHA